MQGIRYNAVQNWGTDIVATSASGATFVNLNEQICDEVTIFIPASGVAIDVICASKIATPTKFLTLDAPSGATFPVTANAKEIMVRRTDNSNTPFTVRYSWRKLLK